MAPVPMWTLFILPSATSLVLAGRVVGLWVASYLDPLVGLSLPLSSAQPLCGIVVWQVRGPQPSTPVSKFSQPAFGHTTVAFAVVSDLSQNEQGMDVSHRE